MPLTVALVNVPHTCTHSPFNAGLSILLPWGGSPGAQVHPGAQVLLQPHYLHPSITGQRFLVVRRQHKAGADGMMIYQVLS